MEDRALFDRLKADPMNQKSSMELAAERRTQEHQQALQKINKVVTAAGREEQARRFRAITAMNELDKVLEHDSIIAEREREVRQQIAEACKDVTSAAEQAEICRRAEPLLKRFATALDDYSVTEWVGHTLAAIRGEKAAKELTGY